MSWKLVHDGSAGIRWWHPGLKRDVPAAVSALGVQENQTGGLTQIFTQQFCMRYTRYTMIHMCIALHSGLPSPIWPLHEFACSHRCTPLSVEVWEELSSLKAWAPSVIGVWVKMWDLASTCLNGMNGETICLKPWDLRIPRQHHRKMGRKDWSPHGVRSWKWQAFFGSLWYPMFDLHLSHVGLKSSRCFYASGARHFAATQ